MIETGGEHCESDHEMLEDDEPRCHNFLDQVEDSARKPKNEVDPAGKEGRETDLKKEEAVQSVDQGHSEKVEDLVGEADGKDLSTAQRKRRGRPRKQQEMSDLQSEAAWSTRKPLGSAPG